MAIRKRLYLDGLWLSRMASEACDPSMNWLDVASLAAALGAGPGVNACYFGLFDPEDPESEPRVLSLQLALEARGVSCILRSEVAASMECTRCGHGWEHHADRALAADLVLAVASDAAMDVIDAAIILSDPSSASALMRLFASRHPAKDIIVPKLRLEEIQVHRLAPAVLLPGGTTLPRPRSWASPRPVIRKRDKRLALV